MRVWVLLAVAGLLAAGAPLGADQRPDRVSALIGLARVKRDAGDPEAARRYFEDAQRLRPLDPAELSEYFWVLAELEPARAVAVAQDVLRHAPLRADLRDRAITAAIATRNERAVEAFARGGRAAEPANALWPRRLAESYLRRGLAGRAAAAYRDVLATTGATVADQAGLALALEMAGESADALAAWQAVPASQRRAQPAWEQSRRRALARTAPPPAVMTSVARSSNVDVLMRVASTEGCDGHWDTCLDQSDRVVRAIERAVASARHGDALSLFESLPTAVVDARRLQTLGGQLRLWTGDAGGAVATLTPLVADQPANRAARESLVDALRATGHARAAWATAEPLLTDSTLSTERRLTLAELALEADAASVVAALVSPVSEDATHGEPARALLGRALLADGRPREAAALLLTLDRTRFSPPSALALVDSLAAVDGADRAWTMASTFTADSIVWSDFLGRRAVLAALTGHAEEAATDRGRLATLDPVALVLADTELALARERPHDALAALASLPANRVTERTEDLRATALIGTGDIPAARAVVRAQHAARPDFLPYTIRDAELTWREQPNAVTLAALLDLAARHDHVPQAIVAGARALLAEARHAEALALLGGPDAWRDLPLDGRLVAARSLRALGRAAEALDVFDDRTPATGAAAILRAELIATVRGADAARREFSRLADAPGAAGDLYLAWAAVVPSPTERVAVLENGLQRFPGRADLALSLASARGAAGDVDGRLAAAQLAVNLAPRSADAWFQLVDATAAGRTRTAAADVLDRFMTATGDAPTLIIALADRLASLVHVGEDPLTARLLGLLTSSHVPDAYALSRDSARVRLLAAAERWPEATAAVDALVAPGNAPPAVLRLRADVLSWAGRHDAALSAYDEYLAVAPDDHAARRQQARVAGWAGRADAARAYYEAVIRAQPDAPGPGAEMRAKIAFIDGRWREAIPAYERWLALEPDNNEARFEYAESLRAAGETARADEALATLAADTGHRLAAAARDRRHLLRQPSAAFAISDHAANGYGGQRLLRLRDQGVTFTMTPGVTARTTVRAEGVAVQALASGARRHGYRLGAAMEREITTVLSTGVNLALWDLARTGTPVWHVGASAAWRAADRWTLGGRFEREPLLETMATIDARMMATGVGGTAAFESPGASATIEGGWQHLSDGNSRVRLSASTTASVHERWRQVRLVGWGEWTGYGREAATYFSPAGFLRLDGGAEYTVQFVQPRFRDDRGDQMAVGFLVGVDNRGTIYRHPSIRASWEFSPGLRLDARGSLIRSRTYNDASVLVSVRVMTRGAGF